MARNIERLDKSTADKYNQVLVKSDYFVEAQLWPILNKLNPNAWLENFRDDELKYALCLLDAFLYYSKDLVEAMFTAAFQGLGKYALNFRDNSVDQFDAWSMFVDNLLITHVTKETPHSTESGYIFERMARQILSFEKPQFKSCPELLDILSHNTYSNIVFVDDFVGSGEQFVNTWIRNYHIGNGRNASFKEIASQAQHRFFYCPVICTEYAYNRIMTEAPEVTVCPAHIMSNKYGALSQDSIVWPDNLRSSAMSFLKVASERAGIPDTGGGEEDWRGFNMLGLTLGFEHSVPDATLPIFYWEQNGWKPLLRRT